MRQIELTQDQVALVDDEDYDYLSQWAWSAYRSRLTWYARRNSLKSEVLSRITILMHREIMDSPSTQVDHINGNGLDNRRSNLRQATNQQNARNHRRSAGASLFRGVSWISRDHKWKAAIRVNYRTIYLGQFSSEVDAALAYDRAALAYDRAALAYFGEFANPNFGVDL